MYIEMIDGHILTMVFFVRNVDLQESQSQFAEAGLECMVNIYIHIWLILYLQVFEKKLTLKQSLKNVKTAAHLPICLVNLYKKKLTTL